MTLAWVATGLPAQRVGGWRAAVGTVLLAAALTAGAWLCLPLPPLADEPHHIRQIHLLLLGRWELLPSLATLPGYHVMVAALAACFGRADLPALRLYSLGLSIVALVAVFALARRARDGRPVERVLQVTALPGVFPLLFLMYTDVAAILLLCVMLLLQEQQRYGLAAVAGMCMLAVRQNDIVWFAFGAVLFAFDLARRLTPLHPSLRTLLSRSGFAELARNGAGYAVGFALFAALLVWNRGLAMGDRAMHPFPSVHLGNVYFTLFLCFVFFLPLHVANARRIVECGRRIRTLIVLGGLLVLFLATFKTDHPYNSPDLHWWLHNAVLEILVSSVWTKLAMFAAIAVALLSLSVTPLRSGSAYLIYAFALLSLLPMWQIEPRYALPFMILFLLLRVQGKLIPEWSLIAYLAALTTAVFWGVTRGAYFL